MKLRITKEYIQSFATEYGSTSKTLGAYAIKRSHLRIIPETYVLLIDEKNLTIITLGALSSEKVDIITYALDELQDIKIKWRLLTKIVTFYPRDGRKLKVNIQTLIGGLSQTQKEFIKFLKTLNF